MNRLRIGAAPCFFHSDPTRPVFKGKTLLYLEQSMAEWFSKKDVFLMMIPTVASAEDLPKLVEELDGLLLQGGSDIAPESYGETPLREEWRGDRVRDQYEVALITEFLKQRKPVLGICRGLQILNVALGGTLYQDIGTQLQHAIAHRDWAIYDRNFHSIKFEPDSRLNLLYPEHKRAQVNSIHHQAIARVGSGLRVEARSELDSIIEAVRLDSETYAFGVQWHPEFQDPEIDGTLSGFPLLQDFLNAVQTRKDHSC
jgi:putative glutamine amidotransferase